MTKTFTMTDVNEAFEKISKREKKSAHYGKKNQIRNARKAKAKRRMG